MRPSMPSEIFGAGVAAGISTLYYPSQERVHAVAEPGWVGTVIEALAAQTARDRW